MLITFAKNWKSAAEQMKKGQQLPGYLVGKIGNEKHLAPLLQSRAELLADFARELKGGTLH